MPIESQTCRFACRVVAVAAAMLMMVAGLAGAQENDAALPTDRPNIVLIVADDLAPTLVNFLPEGQGKSLTPNLDRLAAEGVVLANMHSPSPVCTPSRYAIMTGTYPSRANNREFVRDTRRYDGQTAVGFNTFIQPDDNNLARRLQAAGYTTAAVGKNHVFEVDGFQRLPYLSDLSDPQVQQTLEQNRQAVTRAFESVGFDYTASLYYGNPDADGIKPLAAHNQDWVTDGALRFLDQSHDGPIFMYMATTVPHGPHDPERSFRADRDITPYGLLDEPLDVQPGAESIDQRLKDAKVRQWNAGNVLWLDDAVGALVAKLEARGMLDNTVLIFLSDHGTASKGSVYAEGTRTVSLIWRAGGFAAGNTIDAELSLIDIAPTVLAMAGVAYDGDGFDGKDMSPVLDGEADKLHDWLYFELGFTRAIQKDGVKYLALRYPPSAVSMPLEERQRRLDRITRELTDRGRPIPTDDPMAPFSHLTLVPGGADAEQVSVHNHPGYFDPDQLYVQSLDPKEQVNRIDDPEYIQQLAELRALLEQQLEQMPGSFGEMNTTPAVQ